MKKITIFKEQPVDFIDDYQKQVHYTEHRGNFVVDNRLITKEKTYNIHTFQKQVVVGHVEAICNEVNIVEDLIKEGYIEQYTDPNTFFTTYAKVKRFVIQDADLDEVITNAIATRDQTRGVLTQEALQEALQRHEAMLKYTLTNERKLRNLFFETLSDLSSLYHLPWYKKLFKYKKRIEKLVKENTNKFDDIKPYEEYIVD